MKPSHNVGPYDGVVVVVVVAAVPSNVVSHGR
jgi:hypothetical protein